jgi:cytochrome oxidase Cu insertion factor (SCO1/SenC/PrrC family)
MNVKPLIAGMLITILLVSIVPSTTAYIGHQVSRGEVPDFTLIDQDGNNVSLYQTKGSILVVGFIFTRCPDVCPIITQSLKSVEMGLSDEYREHVEFMSVSLDPRYDTPEMLKQYTEFHEVNWSHLTGDYETMKQVWYNFGMDATEIPIEQESTDDDIDPTLMFVDGDGNVTELMFMPTAWTLTNIIGDQSNWSVNYSSHPEWGHMITGINSFDSPSDWSWYWKFMVYNETSSSWAESDKGIDFINANEDPNIAYLASNADESLLSTPDLESPSINIIYPDNSTELRTVTEFTGWDLTIGALDGAGINFSATKDPQWGHYLNSVNDEDPAIDNNSWYWEVNVWNNSSMQWELSQLGLDSIIDPTYISLSPNGTNVSQIPIPGELDTSVNVQDGQVCNGHGWEMGSGSSKHCMCDSGYNWPEDTILSCIEVEGEDNYTVGHITNTLILDKDSKPKIIHSGYSWNSQDFISDVEDIVEDEGLVGEDSDGISGLTFGVAFISLGLAAVAINVRSTSNRDED